jgi:hypothetical protein
MPRQLAPWLAAAAVLLSACGSTPATSTADPGVPRPGGTLRFAVSSDQGCVDPQRRWSPTGRTRSSSARRTTSSRSWPRSPA